MRFKLVYGAAALAGATFAARGDSMCVVKHEDSGMLFETPCNNLPLHERDSEGAAGKAKEKPAVIYETLTVVVTATITAESLPLTDKEGFSTFSGAYTSISEADVTATLPADLLTTARATRTRDDGSEETLSAVQPAEQTAPIGNNLELLYDCNAAPNGFIICPFDGRNPPPEMFPAPTAAALKVQRDAAVYSEAASAASVLASMVAATNLWPTGIHPFMAPIHTSSPISDCVNSLAEEFALNVINVAAPLPGYAKTKAVSNLGINLVNGTLIDALNRLGSIVANRQLQFDTFGQTGSIYTAGFQACGPADKRLLALGGSTVWWGCISGSFMNLYDQNIAPQCVELQLSLLNNLEPGGGLNSAPDSKAAAVFEAVSVLTMIWKDDFKPAAVEKRATFSSPSDTWLHTMLLSSTPVSVWDPYPVFTTNGVIWSATKTKFHGTHATYVGVPITTAHAKRKDLSDGAANDVPTSTEDISTVVTMSPTAETIIASVNGTATTTASLVFDPVPTYSVPTTLTTEPVTSLVSQAVTTLIVIQTSTITVESASLASPSSITTEPTTGILTTVTELQNRTATTTHSNDATQVVTVSQTSKPGETTPFATAQATISLPSNSTTQVIVLSTVTNSQVTLNGTTQSSFAFLNISAFVATGLTLTHAPTTLLSTSTSFDPSTTTDAIPSGSIGNGEPAASTTVAISGADSKTTHVPGYIPICTAMLVGLTIVFFAEKYLGRLHV